MTDASPSPRAPNDADRAGGKRSRLSLAVAAPRVAARDIERFLASLGEAGLGPEDDVSIAASPSAAANTSELEQWIAARPDDAALSLSLHPVDTIPMRLWGFAMSRARGQFVAVLDLRDSLAAGWVHAWAESAAREPQAIVCGPVDPGKLDNRSSWAAYLSEYGQFWTPFGTEQVAEVPGNNVVFPRALLPADSVLARDGFWKTFHLAALRRPANDGASTIAAPAVRVSPEMRVLVARPYRLGGYLHRRYLHGRCYGGRRLEQPGAPPRALCLGFSPLLPVVRTARVLGSLWTHSSVNSSAASSASSTGHGARSWPLAAIGPLVLGEIAWSWGEFAGYARGAGTACEELW